jgi:7-keto-8-aminopelargonate synthetase-like enzyme
MSNNPQLIEAASKYLKSHGLGLSSVRFICGTQDIHKELERKISEFHGTEDTILYGSCFDANGIVSLSFSCFDVNGIISLFLIVLLLVLI